MNEICRSCETCATCSVSGCIPLVTEDGGSSVEFGTQVDWFDTLFFRLCLALAGGFFLLVLALSAGWLK